MRGDERGDVRGRGLGLRAQRLAQRREGEGGAAGDGGEQAGAQHRGGGWYDATNARGRARRNDGVAFAGPSRPRARAAHRARRVRRGGSCVRNLLPQQPDRPRSPRVLGQRSEPSELAFERVAGAHARPCGGGRRRARSSCCVCGSSRRCGRPHSRWRSGVRRHLFRPNPPAARRRPGRHLLPVPRPRPRSRTPRCALATGCVVWSVRRPPRHGQRVATARSASPSRRAGRRSVPERRAH